MSVGLISHAILKLSRYLCARASNITLLVSLFYMWSVYQAAALVYESVSKKMSSGADPEGRGGGIGCLALQDSSPKKKLIHGKTTGNTWVPKNIELKEICAIAMHVNAEPSTEVQFVRKLCTAAPQTNDGVFTFSRLV